MKISERSYPHPVLSVYAEDVEGSAFQSTLEVSQDKTHFYLKAVFAQNNATLLDLIRQGIAEYVLHLECSSTFFRRSYATRNDCLLVPLSADSLKGRVEVNFFICATQPIRGYTISGSHPDYEGIAFDIRKGDVLAVAEPALFHADKIYEDLKPISSIMRVVRKDEEDNKIDVSYTQFITVQMCPSDYEYYFRAKSIKSISGNLGALVAFPVLIDAIASIQSARRSPEDGSLESQREYKWFRILERKLEALDVANIDDLPPIVLAQAIMQNPLRRGMSEILELSVSEES